MLAYRHVHVTAGSLGDQFKCHNQSATGRHAERCTSHVPGHRWASADHMTRAERGLGLGPRPRATAGESAGSRRWVNTQMMNGCCSTSTLQPSHADDDVPQMPYTCPPSGRLLACFCIESAADASGISPILDASTYSINLSGNDSPVLSSAAYVFHRPAVFW